MAGGAHPEKPIRLFYSYSHRDEELRNKLEDHLAALRWSGKIVEWHDRNIDVGDEWSKEIDRNLSSADIILLLVSASFIASAYCWSVEVKKALERHNKGEAKVIPVILRPCAWHITPFATLQAAPTDAKPVTSWSDQEDALYDVTRKIERVVTDLQQQDELRQREVEEARKREEGKARRAAEKPEREWQWFKRLRPLAGMKTMTAVGLLIFMGPSVPRLKPLDTFTDCRECPEMVVIPNGMFTMGSPENEEERDSGEEPQHQVTIAPFAMGKTEVTFAEWDACVAAGGCNGYKPRDEGWGRGSRPVIHVSWRDAKAYVSWLSQSTRKPYRLPSEAEWEYAARAGTTTRYAFGDAITPKNANYEHYVGKKTTEVGSYLPNAWSLSEMHGNVWEWVEDIWHDNYKDAPTDGTAWTDGEGKKSHKDRVSRGGSWNYHPKFLRSANRNRYPANERKDDLGFRLARTLEKI